MRALSRRSRAPLQCRPRFSGTRHRKKTADFTSPRQVRRFATLADYATATGQEAHSKSIDFSVFRNASAPDFSKPSQLYDPAVVDLRLREGSAAIDAGVELPGITDGFQGRAPDLGAYELGGPPVHYGPRERAHK